MNITILNIINSLEKKYFCQAFKLISSLENISAEEWDAIFNVLSVSEETSDFFIKHKDYFTERKLNEIDYNLSTDNQIKLFVIRRLRTSPLSKDELSKIRSIADFHYNIADFHSVEDFIEALEEYAIWRNQEN